MEYCTNLEHACHGDFRTLDAEHQTDSGCPQDQLPGTTMETDEEGGRCRRRQMTTETVEDGLTFGTSEVAAASQLTTPQSEL